ncbi:MAG: ABC transporter permease, partial [Eubacterium sp.]|nr:ABC transporter permease [Eubacterium sp.]
MKTLIKTSIKLLIRTKIIWLFIVLMPVLSTVILKSNTQYTAYLDDVSRLVELEDADKKVAYNAEKGDYVVKIYDASKSKLSDYMIDRLANSGMFILCRADISDKEVTDEYIKDHIDFDGHEDRMGAALYIPADYDEKVMAGKMSEAVIMYVLSDDERTEAFENELTLQLSRMDAMRRYSAKADELVEGLKKADDMSPEKKVVSVSGGKGRTLTAEQTNQKAQMGYAFSFLTLGFVFAGFFIANGAIKEQKNGVFTRINLSKTSALTYFTSKFVSAFIVSIAMTAVVGACSLMLDMNDLGMNRVTFLLLIFMMGLIFSSLSMFMAIMLNDVFSASIATFTLWCMSSLFSGLYFPLNDTSNGIKILSSIMPQKWFLDGTEMIFVGDNNAYSMLICITVAYLA